MNSQEMKTEPGNNSKGTRENAGETTAVLTERPLWQQISGIDPATEAKLDADARDAAIRKLVREVEARATMEFERAETGKIPEGERTLFWDPLARICLLLGISRTKLSFYTRELTGMRAHEISDRILAKRVLQARMAVRVERLVNPELEELKKNAPRGGLHSGMRTQVQRQLVRWLKSLRTKERRAGFAAELGFANPSRLSRACLLAHGMSIDEMEARLACTLVQKFFSQNVATDQFARMRQTLLARHEQAKKDGSALCAESMAELEEMICEAEQAAKAG